jgi:hypothetical protein
MQTIKTDKGEFLVVEVPSSALKIRIRESMMGRQFLWSEMPVGRPEWKQDLPESKRPYQFLFTTQGASEEDLKNLGFSKYQSLGLPLDKNYAILKKS